MAKRKTPQPMNTEALKTLTGEGGTGYLKREEADKFATAGLVEIHSTLTDTDGNPAVRLTPAGAAFANNGNSNGENKAMTDTTAPKAATPTAFKIRDNVPMPARRAGGNTKGSRYPFDALQPGQSFHIPVTAEVAEPWKKYSSIASSASRRYANKMLDTNGQPIMVTRTRKIKGVEKTTSSPKLALTRVFAIRPAAPDDPDGPGAVVFREK